MRVKESIDEKIKISKKIFAENKTSPLFKAPEKDFQPHMPFAGWNTQHIKDPQGDHLW